MKYLKKGDFPLKGKYVALLAPSFVVDFPYPLIIYQLKKLGFEKIVELTFGAKIVNKKYYEIIKNYNFKNKNNFFISSVCPGIIETIKNKFPQYKENLLKVDSPMIATAKICKKFYPNYKLVFISPCNFKKIEAEKSKIIHGIIDYKELNSILKEKFSKEEIKKFRNLKKQIFFDKFYNDFTKIYPVSGGLSKSLKINKILNKKEIKTINGVKKFTKFLNKKNKNIKFVDVTFCKGGCINGLCVNSKDSLLLRKNRVLRYVRKSHKERIPEDRKGLFEKAKGISFESNYPIN